MRWSQSYDRPITNVFAVQDEIAREVARELLGTLDVAAAATLVRNETTDPEAHSMLLQGIVLWNRPSEQSLRRAIGFFEAIDIMEKRCENGAGSSPLGAAGAV